MQSEYVHAHILVPTFRLLMAYSRGLKAATVRAACLRQGDFPTNPHDFTWQAKSWWRTANGAGKSVLVTSSVAIHTCKCTCSIHYVSAASFTPVGPPRRSILTYRISQMPTPRYATRRRWTIQSCTYRNVVDSSIGSDVNRSTMTRTMAR